jgi:hypothetical protein
MDLDTKKEYADQSVPDQGFTDQDFPDQPPRPELRRTPKIQIVASCIYGIVFATAISGLLIDRWPKAVQLSRFLTLMAVLAPTIAIVGHWIFVTHPNQIAKRLAREKQERNPVMVGDMADEIDPELDDDRS